ncbi:MAG: hypothetical protein AB1726_15925 [Planctomycetota bacterium]
MIHLAHVAAARRPVVGRANSEVGRTNPPLLIGFHQVVRLEPQVDRSHAPDAIGTADDGRRAPRSNATGFYGLVAPQEQDLIGQRIEVLFEDPATAGLLDDETGIVELEIVQVVASGIAAFAIVLSKSLFGAAIPESRILADGPIPTVTVGVRPTAERIARDQGKSHRGSSSVQGAGASADGVPGGE